MSSWERFALVACGGALGSMARYLTALIFGGRALTTFGVNVSGSFLIGLLASLTAPADLRLRLLLATGFLGGYTTFSAWQLESLLTAREGQWLQTGAILLGSTAAGFAAVAAGMALGSRVR